MLNKSVLTFVLFLTFLPVLYTAMGTKNHIAMSGTAHRNPRLSRYVPGEVLVRFRSGFSTSSTHARIASRYSLAAVQVTREFSHFQIQDQKSVPETVLALAKDPDVEFAQPNYIYFLANRPNDPQYANLWGLKNSGQAIANPSYTTNNPGTSGNDIGIESAWDLVTDCSKTTIAVIDSGINYNHEDLAPNMWNGGSQYPNHGWDFINNTNNPMDFNGHGTHVAGTIAAKGNNAVGSVGVCWTASLMALKVFDASGSGSSAAMASAITFAADHGAKVANMSIQNYAESDPAVETAYKYAQTKGMLLVVAAGNYNLDNDNKDVASYPCTINTDNVICVAALDQKYALADFSNFGKTTVDIGAPGTNIYSSYNGTKTDLTPDFFNTNGAFNWSSSNQSASPNIFGYQRRTVDYYGTVQQVDMASIPNNWNGTTAKYAGNSSSGIFKNFNLSATADALVLNFSIYLDVANTDELGVFMNPAGGNPFNATALDRFNGTTGGEAVPLSYDISTCKTANCSIGFRLKANNGTDLGAAVAGYYFTRIRLASNVYQLLDGTSMATPHVAGVAALVWSQNPGFNYKDVSAAVQMSGRAVTSLSGKTRTGRALDAAAAVRYVIPPEGITVE